MNLSEIIVGSESNCSQDGLEDQVDALHFGTRSGLCNKLHVGPYEGWDLQECICYFYQPNHKSIALFLINFLRAKTDIYCVLRRGFQAETVHTVVKATRVIESFLRKPEHLN